LRRLRRALGGRFCAPFSLAAMGRRKTLAEELADLANPAPTRGASPRTLQLPGQRGGWAAQALAAAPPPLPARFTHPTHASPPIAAAAEYDPEAEDAADAPALNDSDEELLGGGAGRPSRSAPERGLRLRGGIELEDTAYRGRTSTRAAAFGDEEEGGAIGASGSEGEEDDEDEGPSGSDGEEGGSSEDGSDAPSEEDLGRAPRRAGGARGGGSGEDDDDDDDDGEDGGGGGSDSEDDGGARGALRDAAARLDGDELRALNSQLGGLAAEDDAALAALRTAGVREREKGRAVARQRRGYDRALELRIHLQRGLAAANRLPGPRARAEALELRPELRGGYARLCEAAHATLAALLALTDAMAEAAPAVGAAAGERGGALRARAKRAREGYDAAPSAAGGWAALEAQAAALAPFRDASVDRWHRRTQLASGAGALRSNMRALDQSVSAQVAAAMRDTERAVARTRCVFPPPPPRSPFPFFHLAPAAVILVSAPTWDQGRAAALG